MEHNESRLVRVGRDPNRCEIVVEGAGVSSLHCALGLDPDGKSLVVEDLDSTNGTFIENGAKVRVMTGGRTPAAVGDRIRLGSHAVLVVTAEFIESVRGHLRGSLDADPVPGARAPATAEPGQEAGAQGEQTGHGGTVRTYTVGRDPECDIVLSSANVSRRHLTVEPGTDGRWFRVRDLGSANGLAVGSPDRKTIDARVSEDDILFLGTYRLPMSMVRSAIRDKERDQHSSHLPLEGKVVIGRGGGRAAIAVDAPMVSREHAEVTIAPDGVWIRDLDSSNGTFVNGQRISGAVRVSPSDAVSLGSCRIQLVPGAPLRSLTLEGPVTLQARHVSVEVDDGKRILDNISLTLYPTEFVGLMGPSGAGKTTLLRAMNGSSKQTAGNVLINGRNLYTSFDAYRGDIGYVPQEDIVLPQLTVFESLYYAARLRLPADTSDDEIHSRISALLKRLEIDQTRDILIGDALNKGISGGQRKRVNVAQELLTEPSLVFLDEPTSGLASEDTLEVMKLLRELADGGRTILLTIHQPSLSAYRLMDNVAYLFEGRLVYYGPAYPDSITFLNSLKPGDEPRSELLSDPGQALKPLASERRTAFERGGEAAVKAAAARRQATYTRSSYHAEYVAKRQEELVPPSAEAGRSAGRHTPLLHQMKVLAARTSLVKRRDRTNTAVLVAQAPLIALVVGLVFQKSMGAHAWLGAESNALSSIERSSGVFFLLVVAAIWFGCSNAAREIVGEQVIYLRERMVSLRIDAYVLSKFLVLGTICAGQCLLLLGVTCLLLDLPHGSSTATMAFLQQFVTLVLCSLTGLGMGLVLSSVVRSQEAAVALVPILLIPQIILGGVLVPGHEQDGAVRALAGLTAARWGFEATMHIAHENETTVDLARLCTGESGEPDRDKRAILDICCVMLDPEARVQPSRPPRQEVDGRFPDHALCSPRTHAREIRGGGIPWSAYDPAGVSLVPVPSHQFDRHAICAQLCLSLQDRAPITALDRLFGTTLGPDDQASPAHDVLRRRIIDWLPQGARKSTEVSIRTAQESNNARLLLWALLGGMISLLLLAVGVLLRSRDPLPR